MASIQETTAVSIRKGSTAENLAFTGTIAEVTADLGTDGTGTDINTTLRLHNGVVQGGIPIARADLTNVTTKALAKNRNLYGDSNLAYADLSNIEELTEDDQKNTVRDYMHSYGLALNTQIDDLDLRKANTTMDNINTEVLATGEGETGKHAGKNLAYADGSNVNAKYFADSQYRVTGEVGDDPLAYANLSNVSTTNLVASISTRPATMSGPVIANSDLTNVADDTIKDRIDSLNVDGQTYRVEYTNNKVNQINASSAVNYPTTGAVIGYVASELNKLDYMNPNLDNASSWEPLYAASGTQYIYDNDIEKITISGSDFTEEIENIKTTNTIRTIAPTNKVLTSSIPLQIAIYSLNEDDHKPASFRIYPEYGTTPFNQQEIIFQNNVGSTIHAILFSYEHPSLTGVYKYSVGFSSNNVLGPDGSRERGGEGWNSSNNADFNSIPKYINISNISATPVLMVNVKTVSSGILTAFDFIPENAPAEITDAEHITIAHPLINIFDSDDETMAYTLQPGNSASFDLLTTTDASLPSIGGASVIKTDFSNLPGMTATDIAENNNASWSINKVKAIPAVTSVTIPTSEYERLATIGQVWDSLKKIDSKIIFRQWS